MLAICEINFLRNQKFYKSAKFIAREIYSPRNICAVQYPPTMLISDGKKASRSKAATTNFTSLSFFWVLKTHRLDYRITWRPDCILQNIDNIQCSYSSFRCHCLSSSFDLKAFLPLLITLWVDMLYCYSLKVIRFCLNAWGGYYAGQQKEGAWPMSLTLLCVTSHRLCVVQSEYSSLKYW